MLVCYTAEPQRPSPSLPRTFDAGCDSGWENRPAVSSSPLSWSLGLATGCCVAGGTSPSASPRAAGWVAAGWRLGGCAAAVWLASTSKALAAVASLL